MIGVSFGLHWIEGWARRHRGEIQAYVAQVWWGELMEGAMVGVVAATPLASMGSGGEFIYFQF